YVYIHVFVYSRFRRHWYRGGNNSCSRTDLVFIPLPDSPLARKRQREILKKQSEIKEEKRERTPTVCIRGPSQVSMSSSQPMQATMGFNPVSSATCSTAAVYSTSAMNCGPASFPPGLSPFTLCFGTSQDLPALQRLKEYASAATNACVPGSSTFYQAALLDPVLQYRISAGLYGAAEKERFEQEAQERQQEQLKRDYEYATKPMYQMSNNALASNAAVNMGFTAASINAMNASGGGTDSRQLFGVPGQYSPVNNTAAMGLSPNQAAAFPYQSLDANALERFHTERLLAERVQLERLTALYPANPMLRLELDRLTAALTALAAQHHTHSHTHSHTHLHIHPSLASSSVQQDTGPTSSVAASTSLWSASQTPNMTDNFMQQYLQQEHFQRQIALERDRIISAQQQQVVLQHNEMMSNCVLNSGVKEDGSCLQYTKVSSLSLTHASGTSRRMVEQVMSRDFKEILRAADMPEPMRLHAFQLAKEALEKYTTEREMANHVKLGFDESYGPSWHCVVGRNYGSFVTHENGAFIFFFLGKEAFLLFKSA
ncbi:unnamed protein product, partial [Soboliphyme baturini]|uniref:Dynein light chain 1, cytoplasmic n=1 Tax=Soboliphyme baturini TaxID=241478 RepID=A0A183J404_9BILA